MSFKSLKPISFEARALCSVQTCTERYSYYIYTTFCLCFVSTSWQSLALVAPLTNGNECVIVKVMTQSCDSSTAPLSLMPYHAICRMLREYLSLLEIFQGININALFRMNFNKSYSPHVQAVTLVRDYRFSFHCSPCNYCPV